MSDFAEDDQQPAAGPSRPSTTVTSQPKVPLSRRRLVIPPSTLITKLTEPKEAPLWLRLAYNACIPCRKAISRCDGHEYYTQACSQCRSKGIECTWALSRHEKARLRNRRVDQLEQDSENAATEHDVDGTPSTSNIHPGTSSEASKSVRERQDSQYTSDGFAQLDEEARDGSRSKLHKNNGMRFPQNEVVKKGYLNRPAVPSAGWELFGKAAKSRTSKDVKGKGKARVIEARASETQGSSTDDGEGIDGDVAQETEEKESTAEYDALLAQLGATHRGVEFLETSSYTALLRSIFAEDSSNLARSLYWWEFSEAAKKLRSRWSTLPVSDKKLWKKMSFLDKILSENTHVWALWPRPPRMEDLPAFRDTIYPPASLDDNRFVSTLPEAIVSTSLEVLHKSSLPDDIINSMTPMHIKAWTQSKRDHGFPATIQTKRQWRFETVFGSGRSKYAIPPSSTEDFAATHLDREELVLDIIEERGSRTVAILQHAIDSVLLKMASSRVPTGMRRPPKTRHQGTAGAEVRSEAVHPESEVDRHDASNNEGKVKGKGQNVGDKASNNKDKGKGKVTEKASSIPQGEESIDEQSTKDTSDKDGQKRKSKLHQAPADWQKVILAAIRTPGLPRRCVTVTPSP